MEGAAEEPLAIILSGHATHVTPHRLLLRTQRTHSACRSLRPWSPSISPLLLPEEREPTDRDAVLAYLTSLSKSGRRSMRLRLAGAARLLGHEDPFLVPWSRLRFEHLSALRTALGEKGLSPASQNAALHAVRGVLRAAWNLGLLPGEDYQRLREVKPVRSERLPRGRAVPTSILTKGRPWR